MEPIPFGQAAVRARGRRRHARGLLATRSRQALEAAERLAADGISVEVIDLRTVAPLDRATDQRLGAQDRAASSLLTRRPPSAACCAEVAAGIQESAFDYLDAPIVRLGGRHSPIPHSPPLFEALVPSLERVTAALREIVAVSV